VAKRVGIDKWLFGSVLLLVVIGVVMVFSASAVLAGEKFGSPYHFLFRQLGWALVGLAAMAVSPFGGFLVLLYSIASVVVGIVFSRIMAEFILIVFRINEHLGAIRDQGGMR